MTSIQENESFIREKPLGASLDSIKSSFKQRDEETSSASSEDTTDVLSLGAAISNLLATLQLHPVARRLRSASSRRALDDELASLSGKVRLDNFDLSPFTPLTTAVANDDTDVEIWKAVLQIIDSISRITPLRSIPNSYLGTPFTRSTAAHQDSTQIRSELEQPLLMELSGCTYDNTSDFEKKYFEEKEWSGQCSDIYKQLSEKYDGHALREFPTTLSENEVWKWVDSFQESYLKTSSSRYFRTKSKKEIEDGQGERQLDLLIKRSDAASAEVHSIGDVLVVGELTSSKKSARWRPKFVQLATYMRDVFSAQPTRRFVHGFLLFATQMQLWVFDRSGAYSSTTFDILEDPERFIRAISGYALMNDEELGLDTFIQKDGKRTSVTIADATTGENRVLELEATPFTFQRSVASRGTTCYRTTNGKQVVKFSWRAAERSSESEHLQAARNVSGIPKLEGSRNIISTKALRAGLTFSLKSKPLGHAVPEKRIDPAKLSSTSHSTQELGNLNISGTKRSSIADDEQSRKRSRPNSRRSSLRQEVSPGDVKKSQGQILKPKPVYQNRVLTCMGISPAGYPLSAFTFFRKPVKQLLAGIRDAIKAHKSLFLDGKILHRDVSLHNIILTDEKETGRFGMLIDLDLAVRVGADGKNEPTEAHTMTGTLEYMAIEILEGGLDRETVGIEHTYRHDLESFFYVLLFACMRYGWEAGKSPKSHPLSEWYTGSIEDIYRTKSGDIAAAFERVVIPKFSPKFAFAKGLARKLRDILFFKGPSKGFFYTGTPEKPEELYDPMIQAFDEAIRTLKW